MRGAGHRRDTVRGPSRLMPLVVVVHIYTFCEGMLIFKTKAHNLTKMWQRKYSTGGEYRTVRSSGFGGWRRILQTRCLREGLWSLATGIPNSVSLLQQHGIVRLPDTGLRSYGRDRCVHAGAAFRRPVAVRREACIAVISRRIGNSAALCQGRETDTRPTVLGVSRKPALAHGWLGAIRSIGHPNAGSTRAAGHPPTGGLAQFPAEVRAHRAVETGIHHGAVGAWQLKPAVST